MTTMPWRKSQTNSTTLAAQRSSETRPLEPAVPIGWQGADCCSAKAAFRVVLRTSETNGRRGELLLCGHHYRRAADALSHREAAVYNERNRLIDAHDFVSCWDA